MKQEWMSIDTAPRDGTVVELRCTYGVAPWYGLHHWAPWCGERKAWVAVPDSSIAVTNEASLSWRPYAGKPEEYRDPTNGYQMEPKYWREAVAMKYGLPLDAFEKPGLK